MKKINKNHAPGRFRRLPLLVLIISVAFIGVAAATVVSRQHANKPAPIVPNSTQHSAGKYVTVKVAGREVQVDPQTGQIKPLTPEEAKKMAEGLKVILNRSTEGLVQVHHPDGSVSMDLQGRFQNVAVARVESDGTLTQSCIDTPEAAASFFGIDPRLLGVENSSGTVQRTPARRQLQ